MNVDLEQYQLAMISEWMAHGNINEYVEKYEGVNRAQLVSDDVVSHDNHCNLLIVGRRREWIGVHAQPPDGTRRLERGMILSQTQRTSTYNNIQANILINKSHRGCLADFGLSTIAGIANRAAASKESLMSFTDGGGTLRWMSPELLDPERFGNSDGRQTKQSDCYALGMVVYEVGEGMILPTSAEA